MLLATIFWNGDGASGRRVNRHGAELRLNGLQMNIFVFPELFLRPPRMQEGDAIIYKQRSATMAYI